MRSSCYVLVLAAAQAGGAKPAAKPDPRAFANAVKWETSFAAAKARAAREKKLVYALFLAKAGDDEVAAYENEALTAPWWIAAAGDVVPYLNDRSDAAAGSDAAHGREADRELWKRLAIDSQPIPCGLFLDATGRLLLDPESPTAALSLPDSERRWRSDLELARVHAELAPTLDKNPEDAAAGAALTLIAAMRSEVVTEPIAEFDAAVHQAKLDPRIAAAWREYAKVRPILEALDGVGATPAAAPTDPAVARAALARRLEALFKSGVTLPLDHHRAFAFHLGALEGARRAGDAKEAQLLSERLDAIVAASFQFRRAEMKQQVEAVKKATY